MQGLSQVRRKQDHRKGFSLIEVTLALGAASVSFAALFGLLPVALQTTQNATAETMATDIVAAVAADLHATPVPPNRNDAAVSPRFAIEIPAPPISKITTSILFFARDGKFTTSTDSHSRYRLTIRLLPTSTVHGAILVHLKVTWPAPAAPMNAAGSAEMLLGLDRN
jgi:hypothetical protein